MKKKKCRRDISTLAAYKITAAAILKHVFLETKNEEVHICIIILNLILMLKNLEMTFLSNRVSVKLPIIEILHTRNILFNNILFIAENRCHKKLRLPSPNSLVN